MQFINNHKKLQYFVINHILLFCVELGTEKGTSKSDSIGLTG